MLARLAEGLFPDSGEDKDAAGGMPVPERIFRLYGNAMFRAAYDILGDDGAAEDAVMDALEKICAKPEYFRRPDERQVKLLVMRTTENAALDRLRKRKRRKLREILLPGFSGNRDDGEGQAPERIEPEAAEKSAEEAYFTREELLRCDFGTLERAVGALPEKYRELVLLRYGEEYGNREIAAMLGIPESTAATRLARARELLKRKIREEER